MNEPIVPATASKPDSTQMTTCHHLQPNTWPYAQIGMITTVINPNPDPSKLKIRSKDGRAKPARIARQAMRTRTTGRQKALNRSRR